MKTIEKRQQIEYSHAGEDTPKEILCPNIERKGMQSKKKETST
jgi:hypothetical protein